jgi:hypothetical protein
VIQRWGETPIWQYFSGNEYFEYQWPRARIDSVKHHGPQSTAPTSWVSLSLALGKHLRYLVKHQAAARDDDVKSETGQ